MGIVRDILHRAPHKPGVYQMKDASGRIFYIGKAKDLHARMHQYIQPGTDTRAFVLILDRILSDVEFFITGSEKEALILENGLIKKHRPVYNVRIKDDSQFFSIRLDLKKDYPRLEVVRRRKGDGARYFGPYSSAKKARRMLQLVNKHFALRDCKDRVLETAERPCLRHQMGRCHAPCRRYITPEAYHEEVRRVRMFLEGRADLLVAELNDLMKDAAGRLDFERAAVLRDQIAAVTGSLERQAVVLPNRVDWDVAALYREGEAASVGLLYVRGGKLTGRDAFQIECRARSDREALLDFLNQHYAEVWPLPDEILTPDFLRDDEGLSDWLSERRERRVSVRPARRGNPRRLLAIASENARQAFDENRSRTENHVRELERLQRILSLPEPPRRIECVDISNTQGRLAVGSLVSFLDGRADKNAYRRFRVETEDGPDDFAMMREVLTRRFKRGREEGGLPDLLVVDGGKGQLGVALAVLKDLDIHGVALAGMAKSRLKERVGEGEISEAFEGRRRTPERLFFPGQKNPVVLKPGTGELHLLQRVRDEAHRFAITYHRQLRGKKNLKSGLLDIPGVGPKRARDLLRAFGSLKNVREADVDAIQALPGFTRRLAESVKAHLAPPADSAKE